MGRIKSKKKSRSTRSRSKSRMYRSKGDKKSMKKYKKNKVSRKNRRSFIKKSRTNKKVSRRNRRMRGAGNEGKGGDDVETRVSLETQVGRNVRERMALEAARSLAAGAREGLYDLQLAPPAYAEDRPPVQILKDDLREWGDHEREKEEKADLYIAIQYVEEKVKEKVQEMEKARDSVPPAALRRRPQRWLIKRASAVGANAATIEAALAAGTQVAVKAALIQAILDASTRSEAIDALFEDETLTDDRSVENYLISNFAHIGFNPEDSITEQRLGNIKKQIKKQTKEMKDPYREQRQEGEKARKSRKYKAADVLEKQAEEKTKAEAAKKAAFHNRVLASGDPRKINVSSFVKNGMAFYQFEWSGMSESLRVPPRGIRFSEIRRLGKDALSKGLRETTYKKHDITPEVRLRREQGLQAELQAIAATQEEGSGSPTKLLSIINASTGGNEEIFRAWSRDITKWLQSTRPSLPPVDPLSGGATPLSSRITKAQVRGDDTGPVSAAR